MKATAMPFYMRNSSLICSKMLQSDGPKCGGMLVDPRATQAKKEGKQQYWSDVKTSVASSSLPDTWLFLRFGQPIIPHLKEESQNYLPAD